MQYDIDFFFRYTEMMLSLKNVMMAVVETLVNKFEEDQAKNREMQKRALHEQSSCRYTDNCSDSDSSFNQVCVCCKKRKENGLVLPITNLNP